MTSNLPPSKLPGKPALTSVSFDMSKGNDVDGLWEPWTSLGRGQPGG